MQELDKALAAVRPVFKFGGMILIVIGCLKLFGVTVPHVPGEWWQIALGGMAVKSF